MKDSVMSNTNRENLKNFISETLRQRNDFNATNRSSYRKTGGTLDKSSGFYSQTSDTGKFGQGKEGRTTNH